MPPKPLSDKVDELTKLVYSLAQRVERLESDWANTQDLREKESDRALRATADTRAELKSEVAEVRREAADELARAREVIHQLRVELAVQRRDLDELRTVRDDLRRRSWAVVLALVSAVLGGLAAHFLKT